VRATANLGEVPRIRTPRRALSILVAVALFIEAFFSPVLWLGAVVFGAFVSLDTDVPNWLDAMSRQAGWAWGTLALTALFIAAAMTLLAQPSRARWLAAAVCVLAAIPNAAAALALVIYNVSGSTGPIQPRVVAIAIATGFGFVAVRLDAEGWWILRRGMRIPMPPAPS